jgi:phosphoserine aminotransferase
MPEITIPTDFLPVDGRFGCGPAKIRPEQMQSFAAVGAKLMGTSHRQAPVKNLVGELKQGLMELFHQPAGYEIVLGNGGSTAFWDVAAYSLAEGRTQALVHGEFGSKFANSLSAPFLSGVDRKVAEPGSRSELSAQSEIKNYVYPQNETSTGVMAKVHRFAGVDSDALFYTDATSAAGGIDFDPLETDVYYFAPQKNFGSDGGLWFALMSPAALERAEKIATTDRYVPEFLSLKTAIDNSRLNQTLNTPAIATLFLMNEQVKWINESGGLSWADEKTKTASAFLYEWATNRNFTTPFVSNPDHRSQVVVTIDFIDEVDAAALASVLRSNGVVDVDPYRKLGRNQLRVATFTSTELSDIQKLTECIDYVVEAIAK